MDDIQNALLADPILLTLGAVIAVSGLGFVICVLFWLGIRRRR
jgi:hypothetical protein